MLITKEQQEAWVNAYVKDKHTADECIGFIDGINKVLQVLKHSSQPDCKHIWKDGDSCNANENCTYPNCPKPINQK